jgi:hypothetical protein
MTWAIEPAGDGLSKLTVTTIGAGPKTMAEFSGGIVHIVSGLKTYLETGRPMAVPAAVS